MSSRTVSQNFSKVPSENRPVLLSLPPYSIVEDTYSRLLLPTFQSASSRKSSNSETRIDLHSIISSISGCGVKYSSDHSLYLSTRCSSPNCSQRYSFQFTISSIVSCSAKLRASSSNCLRVSSSRSGGFVGLWEP